MKNGKIEEQGPVVWKVHKTIIQWVKQLVSLILILWMAIYPVDCAIQPPGEGGGGDSAYDSGGDARRLA